MDINIWKLITGGLSFIVGLGIAIPKFLALKDLLKETIEALVAMHDALKDEKLTKQEIHKIVDEWRDVKPAVRKVWIAIRKGGKLKPVQ